MEDTGTFYGHLVHFPVIWYILWSFSIFFPVLDYCTKKNLATLLGSTQHENCGQLLRRPKMQMASIVSCVSGKSKTSAQLHTKDERQEPILRLFTTTYNARV
jgi:hypothetical protein